MHETLKQAKQTALWALYYARKTTALPFLICGGILFYAAEFIAGEKHMWRPDIARRETIKTHSLHLQAMAQRQGGNGFRKPKTKKR